MATPVMSSRLGSRLKSVCRACMRDYLDAGWTAKPPRLQQQTRNAQSNRNPRPTVVQLLRDLDDYGKKGAWVPVPTGMMRNRLYPQYFARYPTFEEQRAIKKGEIEAVRDFTYKSAVVGRADTPRSTQDSSEAALEIYLGANPAEAAARGGSKSSGLSVTQIDPSRAIALLDILLPETLEFQRKPVPRPESKSKLPASVQAAMKLKFGEAPQAIYGSVSTQDVAALIKESIAYNDEASQIQLSEANVHFAELAEGEDSTRVKYLGQYEVDITMRGAAEAVVRRKISVVEPRDVAAESEGVQSQDASLNPVDVGMDGISAPVEAKQAV